MESGTPGLKSTDDGWLNRTLQSSPEEKPSPFRAVAFGPYLPRTLQGTAPAIAIPDLRQFKMFGPQQSTEGGFEAMYAQTVDQALHGVGQETFEAIDQLKKIHPESYQPENGAQYPKNRFGQSLQEIAELFKAEVGLEVAFLDSGGWDHHVNEGGVQGQLSNLLRDLGQGIAAFHQDMGDRMQDVVFVSMSEFGRTARENGNRGTDHGHANCMFVIGGAVKGGKVYTKWPGLGGRPTLRRPRSGSHHGLPHRPERNPRQTCRQQRSRKCFSGLQSAHKQLSKFNSDVSVPPESLPAFSTAKPEQHEKRKTEKSAPVMRR